eukprot:jgi/Ulvmu1/11075/UM007_0257.1
MLVVAWQLIACLSALSVSNAARPQAEDAVPRLVQYHSTARSATEYSRLRRRLLQGEEDVTGCKWIAEAESCIADGSFFESRGAFGPLEDALKEFFSCEDSVESEADRRCSIEAESQQRCRTVRLRRAVCVSLNSTYTQQQAQDLAALQDQYTNVTNFFDSCPLADTLERQANVPLTASPTCDSGWITLAQVGGCEQCILDLEFYRGVLNDICGQFSTSARRCSGVIATGAVSTAVCERDTVGGCDVLSEPPPPVPRALNPDSSSSADDSNDADAAPRAQAPSEHADGEDDSSLSTPAIVGIAASVIAIAVLVAAATAAYIIRGPPGRGAKKPAAAHPVAASAAAGPDGGAAPAGIYMPPPPGHAGGPPTGAPAAPPGAAPMGRPPQLFIPPDVYPSAQQYMSSGEAPRSADGTPQSHAPPGPALAGVRAASGHMGVPHLRRSSTEVGRLPARDVMVQQTRTLDTAAGQTAEFSILTRAAWDCTVAGSTPPPHIVPDHAVQPEEVLEAQIDYLLNQRQGEILPDLRLAPMLPQRIGQRGAVIFVQQRDDPSQLCAVKFFFEWADFEREAAATRNPDLAAAMPPVKAAHGNPQVRSTAHLPPPLSSYPLPPALVTAKGESLDEHTARTAPDFVTSLSIMIHVTTVVGRLHAAGWVHRDLKPTNAVFLAQQARWALVDFGCAARRGDTADISFSLYYAPPEVIRAFKAGEDQIVAEESADVWALGVIAWELFTKRKFYGPAPDFKWVVRVLMGEEPLPSELPLLPEVREKLGNSRFRNVFLSMLARDPAARPSVSQLLTAWNSVFSQTTSL